MKQNERYSMLTIMSDNSTTSSKNERCSAE